MVLYQPSRGSGGGEALEWGPRCGGSVLFGYFPKSRCCCLSYSPVNKHSLHRIRQIRKTIISEISPKYSFWGITKLRKERNGLSFST